MRSKSSGDSTEILTRTLCDSRPGFPVDGAYLYCQTQSNQQSLFQTARFLVENHYTRKIMVLQAVAKSGYPGFDHWRQQLRKAEIDEEQIEGVICGETSSLNTLIESEAVIRFAGNKGYTSLFIIAPPFQQLRAFMTAVTVALRFYPRLLLYSYPSATMPWQEHVMHSQGTLQAKRSELIHSEWERIETYQKKGDLASFAEILTYLDNRPPFYEDKK